MPALGVGGADDGHDESVKSQFEGEIAKVIAHSYYQHLRSKYFEANRTAPGKLLAP